MGKKASESPIFLGIDVGFGDVKVAAGGLNGNFKKHEFKFPSAVAYEKKSFKLADQEERYEFNGKIYYLGDDAVSVDSAINKRDLGFLLKHYPLLVYKSMYETAKLFGMDMSEFMRSEKAICLGLPIQHFMTNQDQLKDAMESFEVEGKKFDFKNRIQVIAQGQGVLIDFIKNADSENKRWFGNGRTMTILDIGYNTIDVLCVDEGRPSANSSTMFEGLGICWLVKNLEAHLKNECGCKDVNDQYVKKVLEKKYVISNSVRIDLKEFIKASIEEYVEVVIARLQNNIGSFLERSEKIILAGGGAYYVKSAFKKMYACSNIKDFVYCPDVPEYANARGYLVSLYRS